MTQLRLELGSLPKVLMRLCSGKIINMLINKLKTCDCLHNTTDFICIVKKDAQFTLKNCYTILNGVIQALGQSGKQPLGL